VLLPTSRVYFLPGVLNDEKSTRWTRSPEAASAPNTVVRPEAAGVPLSVRSSQSRGAFASDRTVACLGRWGR
jgi:hypothetical protein